MLGMKPSNQVLSVPVVLNTGAQIQIQISRHNLNLLRFEQSGDGATASRAMNNVLLCLILFVQLWNFRDGMFELTLRTHTETSLRGELKTLKDALSSVQDELKALQHCASLSHAHAHAHAHK